MKAYFSQLFKKKGLSCSCPPSTEIKINRWTGWISFQDEEKNIKKYHLNDSNLLLSLIENRVEIFKKIIIKLNEKKLLKINEIDFKNTIYGCLHIQHIEKIKILMDLGIGKHFLSQQEFTKQAQFINICVSPLEFNHWTDKHIQVVSFFYNQVIPYFFENYLETQLSFLYEFFYPRNLKNQSIYLQEQFKEAMNTRNSEYLEKFMHQALTIYNKESKESHHAWDQYDLLLELLNPLELIEKKNEEFMSLLLNSHHVKITHSFLNFLIKNKNMSFLLSLKEKTKELLIFQHPEILKLMSYIQMNSILKEKENKKPVKI